MTTFLMTLFGASIRIAFAAFAVGAVLLLARVRSSSLRHRAWLVVLCAMLLMPILLQIVPHIDIPIDYTPSPALSSTIPTPVPGKAPSAIVPEPIHPSAPNILPSNAQSAPARQPAWPEIIFAAYFTGFALLAARLLAGWLGARALMRASRRTTVRGAAVYECSHVATPLTVGALYPKILLPFDWNEWSPQKLAAVLAHESAHVARRDTAVSFLAHVNACIFWFHPLSWWLRRQLALSAEEECDAAAVRAIGERHTYAALLLEIAGRARRHGWAFTIQGVGVESAGLLGARIDRILRDHSLFGASRVQQAVTAISCALAIFAGAACRENSTSAMPLRADPKNSALLAQQKANQEFNRAASNMPAAETGSIEAHLRTNPEDMEARKKLMIFYQTSGRKVLGDETTAAGFWAQRLWCIEHHPENPCASLIEPLSDSAAYAKATKLWLAVARSNNAPPDALVAAATFFERADPELAAKIVNRAGFPATRRTQMLGGIYARVLADSDSQSLYTQNIRKELHDSNDASLLAATGFSLAMQARPNRAETRDLARSYLERALALDPNSTEARDGLTRVSVTESFSRINNELAETVGREASEAQYRKAAQLPAAQRLRLLPYLAQGAYLAGDYLDYYEHDSARARNDWELARRYAKDALRFSPVSTGNPDNDERFYISHMVSGMVAMRVDGNITEARNELLAASTAKTSGNILNQFTIKLPVLLLRYGGAAERKAVIDYLERYGKVLHRRNLDLLLAARQLRQGIMPL
jgi:BlaR1 peptidase M56